MSERKRIVKRFSQVFKGGLTKQSFGPQCDVNSIVEKARVSGLVSHLNAKKPNYLDVSAIPDYQSALAIVNNASDVFAGLPAKVRERFSNDPVKMVHFLRDKDNLDEAVKLGLVVKKEAKPPVDVVVKPPTPPVA